MDALPWERVWLVPSARPQMNNRTDPPDGTIDSLWRLRRNLLPECRRWSSREERAQFCCTRKNRTHELLLPQEAARQNRFHPRIQSMDRSTETLGCRVGTDPPRRYRCKLLRASLEAPLSPSLSSWDHKSTLRMPFRQRFRGVLARHIPVY